MMDRIKATEEMGVKWIERSRGIKDLEDAFALVIELLRGYEHDYQSCVDAPIAGMLAIFTAMNRELGLTGFQASFIGHKMLQELMPTLKEGPYKILCYDQMLYPQYERYFRKEIDKKVWEWLQKKAEEKLKESASDYVMNHWKSIADGNIPFGYRVLRLDS